MLSRRTMIGALAAAYPARGFQSYFYGKDEPLATPIELTAGQLTMVFEPELAFLRTLRYGNIEVIRGIYAAVRDHNWGTVTPRVTNVKVETSGGGFRLTFDVACLQSPIDFQWHGEIIGDSNSKVQYRMEGAAQSTFKRNRIGFAVLHPVKECAGYDCVVKHSSGPAETGKFPLHVAPNQPFKDMTSISHTIAAGVTAEVAFEGETFEMEDHRNWTDASYKTYCTPLEKPFPVEVKQGDRVVQSITVSLTGAKPAAVSRFSPRRQELMIELLKGEVRPMPKIGIAMAADSPTLTAQEAKRIGALKPAHLRVDLKLSDPAHAALLDRAAKESQSISAPLELAIHLSDDAEAELKTLSATAKKLRVARYIIFHQNEKSTDAKWVTLARKFLSGAPLGGGTNAYFAELNRGRPDASALDFLTFTLNPQVHAFDNTSLVENLAGQGDAVNSARQFSSGKGIVVSPVTFKPRFNPNATGADPVLPPDVLPPPVDPRQVSLFGASWTLGSIKYLAESGAASVTYFETTGPRGLMETAAGSKWPSLFPSKAGQAFPLYHVLADVNDMAGAEVMLSRSSQPLVADGMILRKGNRIRVMVANMSPEAQSVRLQWPSSNQRMSIIKLDQHEVRHATDSPETWRLLPGDNMILHGADVELSLAPYGIARVDTVG